MKKVKVVTPTTNTKRTPVENNPRVLSYTSPKKIVNLEIGVLDTTTYYILLETGDFILLESGDKLAKE